MLGSYRIGSQSQIVTEISVVVKQYVRQDSRFICFHNPTILATLFHSKCLHNPPGLLFGFSQTARPWRLQTH
jgi:hypothetical protein